VAAGNLSVTIGDHSVHLRRSWSQTWARLRRETYYVVVFQLDDGTVRTEYWAVPATSPTTIAAVLTTPGTGLGNLAATQQYVNAASGESCNRRHGGAPSGDGDDQRHEALCCASGTSGAGRRQ